MKTKLLLMCLLLTPFAIKAATIACPGTTTDSGPMLLSTLVSPGFSCEQQDKIYSDFDIVSGTPGAGLTVQIQFQPQGAGTTLHTLNFAGINSTLGEFTIAYMVSVDPVIAPGVTIIGAGLSINASGNLGNPMVMEAAAAFAPPLVASRLGAGSAFADITPGVTSIGVMDHYTPNGGNAQAFSNGFIESAPVAPVPECMTLLLMGSGLVTFGGLKFRRIRS